MGTSTRIAVDFSKQFLKELKHFPEQDRRKISEFIAHLNVYGFDGLAGRNKSSDDISTDDP